MRVQDYVIYSHLAPPRNQQGVLARPRVTQSLLDNLNYPLLIIQAGTGYGKSTELVKLTESLPSYYWYSIQEQDKDPLLFLAKLFSAFAIGSKMIGAPAIRLLESEQRANYQELIRVFINDLTQNLPDETYLVLDDFHHVLEQPEIEQIITSLVDNSPGNFHLILSTRVLPVFNAMPRWRAKGQLKVIDRSELAFTKNEIIGLFDEKFHFNLSDQQAELIFEETEGWAIALQIIWQSIQRGSLSIEQVFTQRPVTLETLFDYLASEVLIQLPEELQRFLITASVLDIMDIETCDMLLGEEKSEDYIEELQERGLFITSLGKNTYQFQNLFRDFLQNHLNKKPDEFLALNQKCAAYFIEKDRPEAAIYHLLAGKMFNEAEMRIIAISDELIKVGRLDTILKWAEVIPDSTLEASADFQVLLGEVKRLKSDFEDSLIHFQNAEALFRAQKDRLGISKALRGQAQIFLDTIRPLKADSLLEEALQLLEPEVYKLEAAALLDQLAENKLNLGRPDTAQELHHEASLLRNVDDPETSYLDARSMLRTGRLNEGRDLLTDILQREKPYEADRPQRFHRETSLLLSLINSFQGEWELAKENALNGIRVGQNIHSSFVEAVGYIRLGHAYEVQGNIYHNQSLQAKAIACYQTAIEKVKAFKVIRVQVEPLWALSRSYGYQGDLHDAKKFAQQAMEIAEQAGDKWLYYLALLSLGCGNFYADQIIEAQEQFCQAAEGFRQVSDRFGLTASLMWQMISLWYAGKHMEALEVFPQFIALVKAGNYDYLLMKPTFLGTRGEQIVIPILLRAYQEKIEREYLEQLLRKMNLENVSYHPGYRIYVHSFGSFEVYRGDEKIHSSDWQREKAKKLFQLLLIHQNEWLNRDQIIERLWPEQPQDTTLRDFKVALNALNKALEPARPKGVNPFFIVRNENLYSINPRAKIWWDVSLFERLSRNPDQESLETARALYKGEFLADNLYEEWTGKKREEINQTMIEVLERLSNIEMGSKNHDECIRLNEELLKIDPTWESAYRNLMAAYAARGNMGQVTMVYQRMKKTLREELNVNPSEASETLYSSLVR